jgi:hypothetical protein
MFRIKILFSYSIFIGLILQIVFAINIPFLSKTSLNNLVYCPLQKTWVKLNSDISVTQTTPLNQICMSNAEKQILSAQILFKKAFVIDEKGVFETLKFGVKFLDNYKHFPNLPDKTFAEFRGLFNLINSKNDLQIEFVINSQSFYFEQFSRPPTLTKTTKFDSQIAQTLEKISRNINPRSPPIFS